MGVDVRVDPATRIVGSIQLRLGDPTPGPARATYSSGKPVHQLEAWLDLMVLQATDPDTAWRSLVVARKSGTTKVRTVVYDLVSPHVAAQRRDAARHALRTVVGCFRRGLREPLPLFPKLSYKLHTGKAVAGDWHGFTVPADGDDEYVRFALGDLAFRELLALPRLDRDPPGAGGRAQVYADHLWDEVDGTAVGRDAPDDTPAKASRSTTPRGRR